MYGHIYSNTIEKVLEECQRKMDLGFNAFGHINPFLDEGTDKVYFKTHVKKMRDAEENVRRMRAVVGPDVVRGDHHPRPPARLPPAQGRYTTRSEPYRRALDPAWALPNGPIHPTVT